MYQWLREGCVSVTEAMESVEGEAGGEAGGGRTYDEMGCWVWGGMRVRG